MDGGRCKGGGSRAAVSAGSYLVHQSPLRLPVTVAGSYRKQPPRPLRIDCRDGSYHMHSPLTEPLGRIQVQSLGQFDELIQNRFPQKTHCAGSAYSVILAPMTPRARISVSSSFSAMFRVPPLLTVPDRTVDAGVPFWGCSLRASLLRRAPIRKPAEPSQTRASRCCSSSLAPHGFYLMARLPSSTRSERTVPDVPGGVYCTPALWT